LCCAAAWAQVTGVTYDVRVFHVAGPTFGDALDPGGDQPFLKEIALAQLSAMPESGLQLNEGTALFWDGDLSRNPEGVSRLVSEDGLADGWVIAIETGDPLQYIEKDEENRFVLKETEEAAGFVFSIVYKDAAISMVGYSERFGATREKLEGVPLDVGKPLKGARVNFAVMKNVPDVWNAWAVMGRQNPESGRVFVFARMHDTSTAESNREPIETEALHTCQFHVYTLAAGNNATAKKMHDGLITRIDANATPPIVSRFDAIRPEPQDDPARDWDAVQKWLQSLDGVELVTAPRIIFGGVFASAHNNSQPSENKPSLPRPNVSSTWPMTSPIVSALLAKGKAKSGVVADIFEEMVHDESEPSAFRREVTGYAIPARLVSHNSGDSVHLGFGFVQRFKRNDQPSGQFRIEGRTGPDLHRSEVMMPSYYEDGFVTEIDAKLGAWNGFTFVNEKTGEQVIVFVTVSRTENEAGSRFYEKAGT